jgi:hypothetical protein
VVFVFKFQAVWTTWSKDLTGIFAGNYLFIFSKDILKILSSYISRLIETKENIHFNAFLLPKVKVEFRHLFSLQKRLSLCSYHNINANIVVFCWLTGLQWKKMKLKTLHKKKSAFVRKHKCWKVHVALYTPCHIHINKNRSIAFLIMNLFQIGLLFSLSVHTYLLTCEIGYWSIFIYVYMTGCVKCHVYFSFGQQKKCPPFSFNIYLAMWKYNCEPLWLKPPSCMPTACHLSGMVNRLLIDFYLCVYDRVCKVPRVLFNICVCERKLIFFV